MTRKNRGLVNFQRALCGDRCIFEGLWRWYHNERLGEEADGGRRGRRTWSIQPEKKKSQASESGSARGATKSNVAVAWHVVIPC